MLTLLDAFAGIGGFSFAAERLVGGFKTTRFLEKDGPCCEVLRKRFPGVPVDDSLIRDFTAEEGSYDVITGGFPCQDISVAGRQQGLDGARSVLFYEATRLLREIRPRFAIFENVGNLLSHKGGETFQTILKEIACSGYDAEWSLIPASDLGACHRRNRYWILCIRADLADSYYEGLERRDCEGLPERSLEQPAWPSHPRGMQRDWRRFISEPRLRRGDDGLSGRVDRLKQLGNAVVPAVAAVPLSRVLQIEESLREVV